MATNVGAKKTDRKAALKELFTFLDADVNGYLDQFELLSLLKNLHGDRADGKAAFKTLQKMDYDRDGKVSEVEFTTAMTKATSSMSDSEFTVRNIAIAARGAELAHDPQLHFSQKNVEKMRSRRRTTQIEAVFHMYDRDKSGTLDLKEFADLAMRSVGDNVDAKQIIQSFLAADKDGNRVIDLKEYKALVIQALGSMDDKDFYLVMGKMKSDAAKFLYVGKLVDS